MRPPSWKRVFQFWQRDPARDVDAELRFHFEERIADLVNRGMTRTDAQAQAEREFGDRAEVREALVTIDERMVGQHRRAAWWEAVVQDVAYVFRGLRRTPGFTAVVVVTLALGLGANTAIFSVLERLFWRQPAGVPAPHQVRRIYNNYIDSRKHTPDVRSVFAYPEMRDIVSALPSNLAIAGFRGARVRLGREADAPLGAAAEIVGDYFGVLGLTPTVGQFFSAEEARAETFNPVAVISHRLWMQNFGGSSSAIGQPLDIGTHRYTIIGVAPELFRGIELDAVDVWYPMSTAGRWVGRNEKWYESINTLSIRIIARVKHESEVPQFVGAATRAMRQRNLNQDSTQTAALVPMLQPVWPDSGAPELTLATRLAGVSVILLLIACANVANLLLARGLRRKRELAVRLALGISQRRLAGLLLTESVMLSLMGAVGAFIVGATASTALKKALLPNVVWGDHTYEIRTALFCFALALLTGVVAGLVPAVRASKPGLAGALRAGARDGGGQRSRLRTTLIVAQAALSVVLVAAAGLFVMSFRRVANIDIGYTPKQILFASASYPEGPAPKQDLAARLDQVAERIRALPGVEVVARAENATFQGISFADLFFPNKDTLPRMAVGGPFMTYVSNEFFAAAGMRVLRGRGFTDADRMTTTPVMVVNETMARAVWNGENPIGKCLIVDEPGTPCREVIGVVSNANALGYIEERPAAQWYLPFSQAEDRSPFVLVVRAEPGKMKAVLPAVRSTMAAAFEGWAAPNLRTMFDVLDRGLHPRRVAAVIYTTAGLLAIIIAAIGIYSSVAYAVSQRMHEMGVRAALGARPSTIITLVLGEGTRVVLIGVALGVGLALAIGRVLSTLLYNTSTKDPALLTGVAVMMICVAAAACLVPALRATRANPVDVLRAD